MKTHNQQLQLPILNAENVILNTFLTFKMFLNHGFIKYFIQEHQENLGYNRPKTKEYLTFHLNNEGFSKNIEF